MTLGFAAGEDLSVPRLVVDENADGTTDAKLAPDSVVTGPSSSETEAPTTVATTRVVIPDASPGNEARPRPTDATVSLASEDGPDGSGVDATYYALDGDTQARPYTGPLTVPLGTVVRFASVDKAGNFEKGNEVLVDDAPSERKTAEPMTVKDRLVRYVDPEGDEDWFSFDADGSSIYRARLHGLRADYDLELYDADGKKLAAPAQRGKRSEVVRDRLPAGRYFLRVVGRQGAWSEKLPYRLDLEGVEANTGRTG